MITLDANVAGFGWFVAPKPAEASEFAHPLRAEGPAAIPGTPAFDRADLLTVIAHELPDLLITGATPYDDDPAALRAVMAEWMRTDLAYAERVEHLRSGGGLNGLVRLDATVVADDGARDA